MTLRDRRANIDANLDDLQASVEACGRATAALHSDTTTSDGLIKAEGAINAPLLRSVLRHVKDLRACARDQREALAELRETVSGLLEELNRSIDVVRPPPAAATGHER